MSVFSTFLVITYLLQLQLLVLTSWLNTLSNNVYPQKKKQRNFISAARILQRCCCCDSTHVSEPYSKTRTARVLQNFKFVSLRTLPNKVLMIVPKRCWNLRNFISISADCKKRNVSFHITMWVQVFKGHIVYNYLCSSSFLSYKSTNLRFRNNHHKVAFTRNRMQYIESSSKSSSEQAKIPRSSAKE